VSPKACPYLGWTAIVTRDAIDEERVGWKGVVVRGLYWRAGWSLTVRFANEREYHYPFNHLELTPA
jgi:hypothetical protein